LSAGHVNGGDPNVQCPTALCIPRNITLVL
jgi:hypothetical protein